MICSEEAIVKRYKETRRIHPLGGEKTLPEGISEEKRILADIRELSDKRIDTSTLSVHDLKTIVAKIAGAPDKQTPLITLLSFGYRYGIPEDSDLVFDVRFLKNPHFTESLRDLDGTSGEVVDFVMSDKASREFLEKLCSFLRIFNPEIFRGRKIISYPGDRLHRREAPLRSHGRCSWRKPFRIFRHY